jgi:alkanesulfonate monooxygenase SsuD/methylene tetrahydromethanopterin reductase-like flavin-dependent oxidoreductase (luciferase family)
MRFAHFAHVWSKAGMSPSQRYDQLWRELQLADTLGFDYGFCVEHHFRPDESWMSSPNLYAVAAGARTQRIRLGAMGHVVPLHHPVRLAEEIALADQMIGGRLEVGLVPGISADYFGPFAADFPNRREKTLEFVGFLKAVYGAADAVDFDGPTIHQRNLRLAVRPAQAPHPPLWMETRDPATLEFCAKHGIDTGYFFFFAREAAKPRYAKYLADWAAAGWARKPNVAYNCLVYVDETDAKALATAAVHAGNAYRGFFPHARSDAELRDIQKKRAEFFLERGEPEAAEIVLNLLDADYLLANELVLIGSPATVAERLRRWSLAGTFNTFFGEFNFGELAEADLMRSLRLFGTEVMPALRGFEPF